MKRPIYYIGMTEGFVSTSKHQAKGQDQSVMYNGRQKCFNSNDENPQFTIKISEEDIVKTEQPEMRNGNRFYQDLFLDKWIWVNWDIQAKPQLIHSMIHGNISAKLGSVSPSNIVQCFLHITSVKNNHLGEKA